ncbi:NAD-dependent epimerase/dehydratase family protein [Pedobacter alluvionis]|uniref:NAD-dependent epimerase/dehydratase family protein n=1 Tax=Pedobacter alluvionis TaxID=475253 RepID=A0A497XYC0_9SPHI|nr:NAD-dependent epimerase/dehydratase family protein [Pedobacter alluvionis]RLJ73899.1 UDP-glucose 4-epimerase [Pedobacter alluvionis]TFB32494.1 NAD-dependent epimerase/dehydratase family protein [Pedobacter alluvionis]
MIGKCLVLGGGGFIGSNLVEGLLKFGYDVRVFDIKNFSKKNIQEFENRIEIVEGDFGNPIDVQRALDGIDYVYHLISTTIPSNSVLNPTYDIETNVLPTINLLQYCATSKIKKIVYISSGGTVYGIPEKVPIAEGHNCNPISSYGIVKRTIESYFQLYKKNWGVDCCVFRLSNPYGERQNPTNVQGAMAVFSYKSIKNFDIEIWGDGEVIRDYIYIGDVVSALIKAISIETPEVIYNLGSGEGKSINDILNLIRLYFNPQLKVKYLEARNFDVPVNILNISLLRKRFQWEPEMKLDQGIKLLYNHINAHNG